jgi:chromosome segregation ATPase
MEPTDLTIEILTGIRQELRDSRDSLRQELRDTRESLGSRIDSTNERLDTLREELSRRIVDSEIRTSTAIADLTGTVREMTSVLRAANDLRPRVERCEHDIADIKRRVG